MLDVSGVDDDIVVASAQQHVVRRQPVANEDMELRGDHWTPTLAASVADEAAALPPRGEEFAPWDGPAALTWTPTLAASVADEAAALPPRGEEFAPRDSDASSRRGAPP